MKKLKGLSKEETQRLVLEFALKNENTINIHRRSSKVKNNSL